MICIPLIASSEPEIRAGMAEAAKTADLVELRLDSCREFDLARLLEGRPCPVIVTYRPKREGGRYEGDEAARIAVLQKAVELGAEYVDVEFDSAGKIRRGGKTKIIVSRHDFEKVPDDLARIHAEIVETGADIAKFACAARDITDNLRVFDVLRSTKHPTIALCMGEAGLISRILGRKYGNFLTFAALDKGLESAPGQITAAEMLTLYRYRNIGPNTAIYGVIGNPVAHSMSPAILNAAFAAAGLDAVYVPFKVEGDPVAFVRGFAALDVQGYSVTIPHKQAILPAMNGLDPLAERIGALNTVVNRSGRLFGTNTDVPGALSALEEALTATATATATTADSPQRRQRTRRADTASPLAGRRVLLLGAGGAARALAYGLTDRGAMVTIANRTHEKAVLLAAEVGGAACPMESVAACEADILINTTSVGMCPKVDESPAPRAALRPGRIVFDAVYNPPETRLLREAKEAGAVPVSGIAWFVHQAALQFELWTGRPAPREAMREALLRRLR